jgi:uncharacterized protein YrrD
VLIDSIRPITTVKDLVMDPESGKLIAFVVDINRKKIIVPMDVLSWHEILKIDSPHDIVALEEVLRVEEVIKSGRGLVRTRVESQDGAYIGKVIDFAVNSKTYDLNSIFVSKGFLGLLRYDSRVIRAKDIVEVLEDKIIVKENIKTVKEKNKSMKLEDMAMG